MNCDERSMLTEIRQRLTRVESRLCRVADKVGAGIDSPAKGLVIFDENEDEVHIETPALDVTLSEILHFLTKEGVTGKVAHVFFGDDLIAEIQPTT